MAELESAKFANVNEILGGLTQLPDTLFQLWETHAPEGAKRFVVRISESTGVQQKHLLWILIALALYILTGRTGDFLFKIIAVVFPGYMSFKALESQQAKNKQDATRWLKYWVVFAAIECISFFTPNYIAIVVSLATLKCIIAVWCILPVDPSGTDVIYNSILSPRYAGIEKRINAFIQRNVVPTAAENIESKVVLSKLIAVCRKSTNPNLKSLGEALKDKHALVKKAALLRDYDKIKGSAENDIKKIKVELKSRASIEKIDLNNNGKIGASKSSDKKEPANNGSETKAPLKTVKDKEKPAADVKLQIDPIKTE